MMTISPHISSPTLTDMKVYFDYKIMNDTALQDPSDI